MVTNLPDRMFTDECGINRCRNGGTCIRKLKKYDCSCMGGFHGDHCEYRDG